MVVEKYKNLHAIVQENPTIHLIQTLEQVGGVEQKMAKQFTLVEESAWMMD